MMASEVEDVIREIKGVSQRILIEALIEHYRWRLPNLSRNIRVGAMRVQSDLPSDFNAMDCDARAECMADTVQSVEAQLGPE